MVLTCIFLNNTVHKLWTKRTGWFVMVCVSMYWSTVRLDFWNGLINGEISRSVLHMFWGKKGYCRLDLVWPCGLNDDQNVDQVSCAPGDYLPVQIHPKAILFIYSWTTTRCETKCGIWQWWTNLLQKCTLDLTKTSVQMHSALEVLRKQRFKTWVYQRCQGDFDDTICWNEQEEGI